MFKKYGKIILIIVLIIQIATPISFLLYQINIKNNLENETEFIKLNINEIYISDNNIHIEFDFSDFYEIDNYYDYTYIIFEPSKNNEYSSFTLSNTPEKNKQYIFQETFNELNWLILEDYNLPYNIIHENLYNKYAELENVATGNFTGPLTEAYALLKIYKNQFKIVEIYIDNYTLKDYIELYKNNEINITRFVYHDYYEYNVLTKDDYLKVIEKNKTNLYNEFLNNYGY